jgi:CHAT domain-containing protein
MNEQRQNAYFQLIYALLNCSSGEELEILPAHPDLFDAGLVQTMLQVAANMIGQGDLDTSNRLMNFAGQMLGVYGGTPLQAISGNSSIWKQLEADQLMQQGVEKFQCGQSQAALHSWQQALTIFQEIGNRQGEGSALGNIGSAYQFLGNYSKAIEYHEQHLVIARETQDRKGEGAAIGNLGLAYNFLEDYQKAIDYQQQSLTIAREVQNRSGESAALVNLGLAHNYLRNYDQAITYLKQGLEITREIGDRYGEGQSLEALGIAYYALREYAKAIEYYQQFLRVKQQFPDPDREGFALRNLGHAYHNLKEYGKAIEYTQQYLVITQQLQDPQEEWQALGSLGSLYRDQGNYAKAIEYLQQCLLKTRELQERRGEARALGELGVNSRALGNYTKAIDYHQQRLVIWQELQERQEEANALGDLGVIYHILGDCGTAIKYNQQQLIISQELHNREGEKQALGNLGINYFGLGKYAQAIEYFNLQLLIAQEIPDRRVEAAALGNLGAAYYRLGDYKTSKKYTEQLLELARELLDHPLQIKALNNLGVTYHSVLEDPNKAIEYYQQSLSLVQERLDRQGEVEVLINLGSVYYDVGDNNKALEYYQQGLAIAQQIKYRLGEEDALGNLGLVYSALKDNGRALECQKERLKIAQEIQDPLGEGQALYNIGILLRDSDNLLEAEQVLRAAIKIWESMRAELGSNDAYKVSIFDTQASTYRLLETVLIYQNKAEAALEIAEQGRARAFVELLARRLSHESSTQTIEPLTIRQIQQIAKTQNATLVEYSIYSGQYHGSVKRKDRDADIVLFIWVIKPTGEAALSVVDLTPLWQKQINTLEDLVIQVRESLEVSKKRRDAPRLLRQLHEILIHPIAELLPNNPEATVIFIPQQSLFLVPFPALLDPETGKFLIEKHTILTAPSIQVLESTHKQQQYLKDEWASNKDEKNSDFHLVVGNPTMPSIAPEMGQPPEQLHSLEGAEEQAKTIAKLLNTQPIIGDEATKVNVVQQMLSARLIHLATHGLLDDIRELGVPGAIALAPTEGVDNGFLTAGEILELKLKAELVVLSACLTGLGKITGDGVIGLSRCLFVAGVPSVIASLWSVPDESTQYLMTEFYDNHLGGMNKAKALRQAILTTKQKFRSPLNWAGFTLIGEAE